MSEQKGHAVPTQPQFEPKTLLPDVIDAARIAGDMLAREFALPEGPRFSDHVTAPIDHEIEMFLRDRLIGLLPARFVGEEAGIVADAGNQVGSNQFCWVVDPHDGTRAFLEGKRGSAVSIALMRDGALVLGVVYAPLSPDRGPDMIAWAEGTGITRNGAPVAIDLRSRTLAEGDVVFLNHGVWQRPIWNGAACAPGNFMPLPSIAYRLARVAVGDGIATQTLRPVNALDIAAGHALLLAAGGVLTAEDGTPVTYSALGESRPSACFGGAPLAVETLRARAWRGSTETRRDERIVLTWPRSGDDARQDRAVGCLLGMLIGDRRNGTPSDAVAQAIVFARSLIGRVRHEHESISGLLALPRAAPIGIAGGSSADPACAAIAAAIDAGIEGADRAGMLKAALQVATEDVRAALLRTGAAPDDLPPDLVVLKTAFDHLISRTPVEAALIGSTASITGALLGAAEGRTAFPPAWVMPVLTDRPAHRHQDAWGDDLVDLAEALLLCRRNDRRNEKAQ